MKQPTGRPPKPSELHRRLGNPGHKSLPDVSDVRALDQLDIEKIELPDHVTLGKGGQWLFDYVIEHVPWLAPSDLPVVIRLAQLQDDLNSARLRFHRYQSHKDARVMRDIDKMMGAIFSALGMSPADRTRLNVGEVRIVKDTLKIRQALHDAAVSAPKQIVVNAVESPNAPKKRKSKDGGGD